jgi:hypothetical protein
MATNSTIISGEEFVSSLHFIKLTDISKLHDKLIRLSFDEKTKEINKLGQRYIVDIKEWKDHLNENLDEKQINNLLNLWLPHKMNFVEIYLMYKFKLGQTTSDRVQFLKPYILEVFTAEDTKVYTYRTCMNFTRLDAYTMLINSAQILDTIKHDDVSFHVWLCKHQKELNAVLPKNKGQLELLIDSLNTKVRLFNMMQEVERLKTENYLLAAQSHNYNFAEMRNISAIRSVKNPMRFLTHQQ